MKAQPSRPNSSPMAEKMKSVCWAFKAPTTGAAALEQPLAGQAAAGEGTGGSGQSATAHPDPGGRWWGQKSPESDSSGSPEKDGSRRGGGQAQSADATQKPPQLHPPTKAITRKINTKNQGHTGVPGQHHVQPTRNTS